MPWTTEQKIFIVEAYFSYSFRTRHIFCCRVTWTLKTTSSGEAHPLSTVCKGHYTLWSALPGLPSLNMASLDHSGSRTTMSSVWQSTPSDMSRCLASSGQHLVDGKRLSGSSSGSSKMVPPPTPQKNHWHGYSSVFLTDWSAAGVTRSGRRIHRTWTPPDFYLWGYLKDRVYANNPQSIPDLKAAIAAAIRAITREECGRVIENFARWIQVCLQHRGAHFQHIFLSASETKKFCSTDLKFSNCLLHRKWPNVANVFFVNINKTLEVIGILVMTVFFVSPCTLEWLFSQENSELSRS